MYTVEKLLEISEEQLAIYQGTVRGTPRTREQMDAYNLSQQAETCAIYLDKVLGGGMVEQIGPFGNKGFKRGQKVRIKKGTPLLTMHPRYKERKYLEDGTPYHKLAGRDYVVTLHSADPGFAKHPNSFHAHELTSAVREERVEWAGESGYWTWCDARFVEPVE